MCENVEGSRPKAVLWSVIGVVGCLELVHCNRCNFRLEAQRYVIYSAIACYFNSIMLHAMILVIDFYVLTIFRCCHMMINSIEIPSVVSERVVCST